MDAATSSKALEQIRSNSGWVIALGVGMMMLGVLAMASPLVTGIAIAWMVGFLMLVGGVTRIVFAFRAQSWGLGILCVLLGGLGILAGLLTLAHPLLGLGFLTLLLAGYLVVEGVTEAIFAFQMRPLPGWGWGFFCWRCLDWLWSFCDCFCCCWRADSMRMSSLLRMRSWTF